MSKTILAVLTTLIALKLIVEVLLWLLSSIQSKEPTKQFTESYMAMVSEWISKHKSHFESQDELALSVDVIFGVKDRPWIDKQ